MGRTLKVSLTRVTQALGAEIYVRSCLDGREIVTSNLRTFTTARICLTSSCARSTPPGGINDCRTTLPAEPNAPR